MNLNKKTAFTLIEVLIVVVIIAILVTILIFTINPAQQFKQTRDVTRWNHLNTIANAIYSYYISHRSFPAGCPPDYPATTKINSQECQNALIPKYLLELPVPPLKDENYIIGFNSPSQKNIKVSSDAVEAADIFVIR